MAILLIEDDAVLADGLIHGLGQNGLEVVAATTAADAERLLATGDFKLILLDLGLPDVDGLEFLQSLRRRRIPIPAIILTARDGLNDRIEGIKRGGDDYLTKPFELTELEARIHALLRRCYGGFDAEISVGRLTLDTRHRQILGDREPIALSSCQYSVLELLLTQAGKVVSRDRIARRMVLEGAAQTNNAIDICIHRLRRLIARFGVDIQTVRGLGYLLDSVIDEKN